jgi:hypothetical protein
MHEFNPKNLEELLAVQRDFGSNENQRWRQVIGYWEMWRPLWSCTGR